MNIAVWATARCGRPFKSCRKASSSRAGREGFLCATLSGFASRISGWRSRPSWSPAVLGTWQMWVRSPLGANIGTPGQYFMSVTAHGVAMAYVLTTFFIMGFGYFVAVTALDRPLPGRAWAWAAFWIAVVGVVMALVPILTGHASVLFTFYPPLTASPWFYIGLVLVVAGSWIWCVLMLVAMRDVETRESGAAGAAGHVRDGGERGDVALDHGRRGGRAGFPGHPGGARAWCRPSMRASRARCSPGRCTPSSISG